MIPQQRTPLLKDKFAGPNGVHYRGFHYSEFDSYVCLIMCSIIHVHVHISTMLLDYIVFVYFEDIYDMLYYLISSHSRVLYTLLDSVLIMTLVFLSRYQHKEEECIIILTARRRYNSLKTISIVVLQLCEL